MLLDFILFILYGSKEVQSAGHKEFGSKRMIIDEVHVRRITAMFRGKLVNPFTIQSEKLVHIVTRVKVPFLAQPAERMIIEKGEEKLLEFVEKRLNTDTELLSAKLARNNIPILGKKSRGSKSKVEKSPGCFSELVVKGIASDVAMTQELHPDNPRALFTNAGTMIKKTKSILMQVLEEHVTEAERNIPTDIPSRNFMVVVDAMWLIHCKLRLLTKECRTFGELADRLLVHYILQPGEMRGISITDCRFDVVLDIYAENSIKDEERQQRKLRSGKEAMSALPTLITDAEQQLPPSLDAFMQETDNKTELVAFLAKRWLQTAPSHLKPGQTLVIGGGLDRRTFVLTTQVSIECPHLFANLDEADPRISLHIFHGFQHDNRTHFVVLGTDTDIAVVTTACISASQDHPNVWQCINNRKVPLHVVARNLGQQKCSALLAFHSLTGCDTTSALSCFKSKVTLWNEACSNEDVLPGLAAFGNNKTVPQTIPNWMLEFIIKAYCGMPKYELHKHDLVLARIAKLKILVSKKQGDDKIDKLLPPTPKSLLPHVQRAYYQTYLWRQACEVAPFVPPPTQFGWERNGLWLTPIKMCVVDSDPEQLSEQPDNSSDGASNSSDDQQSDSSDDQQSDTSDYEPSDSTDEQSESDESY